MFMMSEYSDIVKQGYLKTKSQKLGHWQKRWVILRCASSRGPNRLERYENEKTALLGVEPKVINLKEVQRVERSQAENRLHVLILHFSKANTKKFAADSDSEASDWYSVFERHIGQNTSMVLAAPGLAADQPDPRDMLHVYLLPNTNTDYSGEYLLQVTAESIILREPCGEMQPLITWKLNTLRNYGRDDSKFTFEAGRLAETGEGLFIFTTVESELVYQKVHSATQALVTVQSMNRRKQAGLLSEQSSKSGHVSPVTRHNSDTSVKHNPFSKNQRLSESKSLPVSPTKAPCPPPRPLNDTDQLDSNANSELFTRLASNHSHVQRNNSNRDISSRPLPPPPKTVPN